MQGVEHLSAWSDRSRADLAPEQRAWVTPRVPSSHNILWGVLCSGSRWASPDSLEMTLLATAVFSSLSVCWCNHFRMQSKKFKGFCGFSSLLHSKHLLALNLMDFVPSLLCVPFPALVSVNAFHSLSLAHTGPFIKGLSHLRPPVTYLQ